MSNDAVRRSGVALNAAFDRAIGLAGLPKPCLAPRRSLRHPCPDRPAQSVAGGGPRGSSS